MREVVESVEAPEKQFEGGKRLYREQPVRRCQELVGEVIRKLRECRVLGGGEDTQG